MDDVPYIWVHNSKTKALIKKLKTCGPPFIVGQKKVTKEVLVCVASFWRKLGTKRRGVFLASPVIEVVR